MISRLILVVAALQQAAAQGLGMIGAGGGLPIGGGGIPPMFGGGLPIGGLPLMGNALLGQTGAKTASTKCTKKEGCPKKAAVSPVVGIPQPRLPLLPIGMQGLDYRTGLSWGQQNLGGGSYLTLRRDKYPIHGGFSPWGGYSACSAVCGGGFMTRRRYCNNPIPRNGGLPCMGVKIQTVRCNTHQCPVRGNWGPWSEYSQCSAASCGLNRGFQRRTRNCNNPPAMFGGLTCRGPAFQDRLCTSCPASNIGNSGMGGQCLDSNILACKNWGKAGYCSSTLYYRYMSLRCCATCKVILAGGGGNTGGGQVPPTAKPSGGSGGSGGAGGSGGSGGTATVKPPATCVDKNAVECKGWNDLKLCKDAKYKDFLASYCCKTCTASANIRERDGDVHESYHLKFSREVYIKQLEDAMKKIAMEKKNEK